MHEGRLFDVAGGSLTFVIDETLERRWGRRINKRGHCRDPLASSRRRAVSTSGLRWVVLTLVHATLKQPLLGFTYPRIKSGTGFERAGANTTSQ